MQVCIENIAHMHFVIQVLDLLSMQVMGMAFKIFKKQCSTDISQSKQRSS